MPRHVSKRCIAFVEFLGQYLRTLGLEKRPAVVYRGDRIVDVSESAFQRGVTRRLSVKEARMLLGQEGCFAEFKEEEHREEAERWLPVLLRYTDLIQPVSPSAAYVDLSAHPAPQEIVPLLLRELYEMQWLPMRAGVAPSRWLARLSAQPCDPRPMKLGILPISPVDEPQEWLAGKRIALLSPIPADQRERMKQLGLQFVRDLQSLSDPVLSQQFGKSAPLIRAASDGSLSDPVVSTWPKDSLTVLRNFEDCQDALMLDRGLGELAREAASRLSHEDRVANGMLLYVVTEPTRVLQAGRELKRAIQTATEILTHLRHLCESLEIDEPVRQIRMVMTGLDKSTRRQLSISTRGMADHTLLDPVMQRIRQAYGRDALIPASEIVAPREKQVLKAWKEAYGWR